MTKITVDRALIEQAIAGAIFDFAGYLTSHPDTIEVGSVANAAVMVERIRAWAGYSGLSIENANVEKWNDALAEPAVEPRPVTPYTCPKCYALWLHWPSEQTGIDTDTLNCRSAKWCDYCEKGGVEQLKRLERVPASLKAPVREPSPPPPTEPAMEPVAWRAKSAYPPGGYAIFQQYPQKLADLGEPIEPLYTTPQAQQEKP